MDNNADVILEIDLMRLLRNLWSKVWVMILATVLGGVILAVYSVCFVAPMYTSSALMYVNSNNLSLGDTKVSITQGELSAAQSLVDTYSVILDTRNTLNDVIAAAELPYSYEELREMIHSSSVNDTEVFCISVTNSDPEMAARIANAIARILPEKIAGIVEGTSVRVVDMAVIPARPTSPNVMRNTMLGSLMGLLLMLIVLVVQELMDDLIYDTDYLIQTYDLPILAEIPDLMEADVDSYDKDGFAGAGRGRRQ